MISYHGISYINLPKYLSNNYGEILSAVRQVCLWNLTHIMVLDKILCVWYYFHDKNNKAIDFHLHSIE